MRLEEDDDYGTFEIARITTIRRITTDTCMKFCKIDQLHIVYNINFIFCIIIERSMLRNANVLMVWI